jgi:hypothetical protein
MDGMRWKEKYGAQTSTECGAFAHYVFKRIYARIRPLQLKQTVGFYEARANRLLSTMTTEDKSV